jgi:SAM-dependent methyltransferase
VTEQQYVNSQNPELFENERLALLENSLDPMTIRHLEKLGVIEGWNCLEVGAGKGSVAIWLAKQVGSKGRVLATDLDTKFLQKLNIHNLEVRQHDILKDGLKEGKYDLVHCRGLLAWLPQPEKALEKMARATKPGGWFLIEEPDFSSFGAVDPTYPSADLLNDMLRIEFEELKKAGFVNMCYGRRVRGNLDRLGFLEVGNDGNISLDRGGTKSARFHEMGLQAGASVLVAMGLLKSEQVEAIRPLFQDPEFYFVGPTFFCAWGKRPQLLLRPESGA